MTVKEWEALRKEYEDAMSRVEFVHTGDSRSGDRSYSDWTDYYEMKYTDHDGERKSIKMDDGGPNRSYEQLFQNKVKGLQELGLLREDYPVESVVDMDMFLSRLPRDGVSLDEIPKNYDIPLGDEYAIIKIKKDCFPERLSANELLIDANIGAKVGYYGQTFSPLTIQDIQDFLHENGQDIDLTLDAKVKIEKLSHEESQWAHYEYDYHSRYAEQDYYPESEEYGEYYWQPDYSDDAASAFKITIETPEGASATVFAVQVNHYEHMNTQNNRTYCHLFTEEQAEKEFLLTSDAKKLEEILMTPGNDKIKRSGIDIFAQEYGFYHYTKVVRDMIDKSDARMAVEALANWIHSAEKIGEPTEDFKRWGIHHIIDKCVVESSFDDYIKVVEDYTNDVCNILQKSGRAFRESGDMISESSLADATAAAELSYVWFEMAEDLGIKQEGYEQVLTALEGLHSAVYEKYNPENDAMKKTIDKLVISMWEINEKMEQDVVQERE